VTLGAFNLSADQIEKIDGSEALAVTEQSLEALPEETQDKAKVSAGEFFFGANPAAPAIGDTKVRFEVVKPRAISIIALQQGQTFAPYQAKAGDTILLVSSGTHSGAEMFKEAQDANTLMTWLLRGGGFLLMMIGLVLIFNPIATFGKVVPLVGTMLGAGIGVFAFVLSLALSSLTIAAAWVAYRPVLGISLLVVAIGSLVFLSKRGKSAAAVVPPPIPS
jgi:hypothetical protein